MARGRELMPFEANCPACGATVTFKSGSSVVVVCDYCHSVVARTDRALEDLGKVADVVESGSPLAVGTRGVYRGVAFELTGRAQLGHAAGGMWDEWYASFPDSRWGWLAEAQGRFYLTFEASPGSPLPAYDELEVGGQVRIEEASSPAGVFVVAERGEARYLAAEGEIPYRLVPDSVYSYADLSGQADSFATIDYGDTPPNFYTGRQVTLSELGIIAEPGRTREREARRVTAAQLQCPHCGGPLELRAPDSAERVTCPNCSSLLDVNQGQLKYLKTLSFVGHAQDIPLGATGEFAGGQSLTVIGFMTRSVEFEGVRYYWQEYLLYNPQVGFRWLVQSDGHWSFVEAVPVSEVEANGDNKVRFRGQSFKVFQDALARVDYVAGEFYWKVEVGEPVRAVDYVSAPLMLSKEVSGFVGKARKKGGQRKKKDADIQQQQALEAEEINWSLGTYMPLREVERAFRLDKSLPSPHTVAPNQPFPHKGVYKYWVVFLLVTLVVGIGLFVTGGRAKTFEQSYRLSAGPPPASGTTPGGLPEGAGSLPADSTPGPENTQVIFTEPFEVRARQNLRISGRANVNQNWLYVAGDLIDEKTGLVQQFDLPIEYYSGVDGGESWSEGGQDQSVYLSALPAGTYTMRLEAQWEKWNQPEPPQFSIRVEQGVPRLLNLFLALVAISLLPLLVAFLHMRFEQRRWADSSFNPYEGGDDDDDE